MNRFDLQLLKQKKSRKKKEEREATKTGAPDKVNVCGGRVVLCV